MEFKPLNRREEEELNKGLGYQAIRLEAIKIKSKSELLYYPKDKVDKIIARLKERIAYLSKENSIRLRRFGVLVMYEKTMAENKIYSPYDLDKHFEELKKKK